MNTTIVQFVGFRPPAMAGDLLLVATLWAQKSERFVCPTNEKEICFESHYFYARLFRQDDTSGFAGPSFVVAP